MQPGKVQKAPENFLSPSDARTVMAEARQGASRVFAWRVCQRGCCGGCGRCGRFNCANQLDGGDPNILNLPEHSKGLGQGVATQGYGQPSKYEANVQRRPSPGLTQTTQASVSFAPLQSMFGIITPSGLHFERHHQGLVGCGPDPTPADGQRVGTRAGEEPAGVYRG